MSVTLKTKVMSEAPQFLIQSASRLSIKEAEKIVDDIFLAFGVEVPAKSKRVFKIVSGRGEKNERIVTYTELLEGVRQHGICDIFQQIIDSKDFVFGGTLGASSQYGIDMKTEWAGYTKKLRNPFRIAPSELELSDDIEFYKEESCIESCIDSDQRDFEMCSRNYRGYLFASIALVDCYINKHILVFKFQGKTSPNFERLQMSTRIEERIELFVTDFCDFTFTELKQTLIWSDFMLLKGLRNQIVHSTEPFMGISLREICLNLNLSIRGIGALLKKLQEGQGRLSLGFIEKVRTSRVIEFNEIIRKRDGSYHQKRLYAKPFVRY